MDILADELDIIDDDTQIEKHDARDAYLFCPWDEFITQRLPEAEAQVGISWDKWRRAYCPYERGRYGG